MSDIIKFKKAVNVSHINLTIDKALQQLRAHYNTVPIGAEFDRLVSDFTAILPNTILKEVVYASVMTLAGTEITPEVIRQTTWRLAANIDKLKRGIPIGPWTVQTTLEWCAVRLVRATISRDKKGRLGYWYDYRVLSGTPAGLRFNVFWSIKYIKFMARMLGFNRKSYRFTKGEELVGMRLYLLFDPSLSTPDKPGYYHYFVPDSCKAINRSILKQRARIIPCPKGFQLSELPCHRCPIGYDKCKAGCHPFTFEVKPCPRCMSEETYFDPVDKQGICVDCVEKVQLQGSDERSR